MAVLAAAALLDELMGRNRNIAPNEKAKELNWEDPEYCKYYLVKFCPHDLFVNTRADLGACPRVHDDEVKKLFDSASSSRKLHYQEEFIRFCSSMVTEVERKIAKGKQRLALSGKSEVAALTPAQTQRNSEQITLLSERINGLVEEAERAGTEGNVEQAQGLMKLCDQLKEERETLRKQNENSHWSATAELAAAQEKQMEVCDVCGAFLIVGDAQQRIDDHLMGKQHVGYARLKIALDEISTAVHATREDRRSRYGAPGGLGSDERRHRERERERYVEQRDRERDRSERERPERNERPESGDLDPKPPTLFVLVYRSLNRRERVFYERRREFKNYGNHYNKKFMHGYNKHSSSRRNRNSSSSKDSSSRRNRNSSSSKDSSSSKNRDSSSSEDSSSSKNRNSISSNDTSSRHSSSSSKDKSSTTNSSPSRDTYSSRASSTSSERSYGWLDKDRERNDKDRRIKEKSRDRERRERRGGDRDGNKREKERDRDRRHRSERDSGAYNSHNKDSRGSSFRYSHRSR